MFKLRRGSRARKASEPQVKKLRAMHNYFFTSSRTNVQFRAKYEFLLGLLFYIFLFVSHQWSVGEFFEPLRCNVLSFHTCTGMKHLTSVSIHARTQLPRAAKNVNIPFCATQWSHACVLRDDVWIQSPYSTKHVLCTMTHYSLSEKSFTSVNGCYANVFLSRRALGFASINILIQKFVLWQNWK